MTKRDSLSITSENIFPTVKKWLYSGHDIFYRGLINNGCDAITKLKKLELMGEYGRPEDVEYKIQVTANPTDKTIKITSNGLSMTEEEIDKYINQIAFSGIQDFMSEYKDKANENQIIEHFGLGFYSVSMVADKVGIESLSWQRDARAAHQGPEDGIEFEMEEGDKTSMGATITLYLNEDSTEFYNEYGAREVIEKYCAFMSANILLDDEMAEPQYETIEKDGLTDRDKVIETVIEPAKTEEKENEDGTKETAEIEPFREKCKILKHPVALNDINPLWNKHPNEYNKEGYKSSYRKVFRDYEEPLLWIHLNMDYPFNLKGVLYFPKINMGYDSLEETIKLYNSQVLIANNTKEMVPEFLILLKSVIDYPDLPLSVSRNTLQNDGFVKKIPDYITKKVADKLSGVCKADREDYEGYWDDIAPLIKFGYIKDERFAEKMGDFILYKNLDGKYPTLQGCLDENKEKHENTVPYVTNEKEQNQYISVFKEERIDVVIMPAAVGNPFISHVEQKEEGLRFLRIDTDLSAAFKEEVREGDEEFRKASEELSELFKKALGNDKLDIRVGKTKDARVASMITTSRGTRRIQDMMRVYNVGGMDMGMFGGTGETLVLSANHPLVQYVLNHKEGDNTDKICEQSCDLASLSHSALSPERMTKFVSRSNRIMMIVAGEKAE